MAVSGQFAATAVAVLGCTVLYGYLNVNGALPGSSLAASYCPLLTLTLLPPTLLAGDTICRLGGDEFVLLLEDVDSGEKAIRIIRKIVAVLSAPCLLDGTEVVVSASFGIALYPEDGRDADSLMKHADAAMYRSKRDGRQIELEITESTLMADPEAILQTLEQLKMLRLSIAIDDFGTGYSSLGYLKRFPVDTIKIDHTFIRDLESDGNDRALVHAILAMSHSLDLNVIAEGVETEGQADILTRMGCPLLQGYLFSKPTDARQLLDFVRQHAMPCA